MYMTNQEAPPMLILASGSPRRRDLLRLLGLPFTVRPSAVDERNHADETAAAMVSRLSQAKDAVKMLRRLRGRAHTVFSSVTLLDAQAGWMRTELARSQVWMRNFSDEEIATYVATGDPLDKAGSYAIQYAGFRPVARIAGCYANVMGFPLCHLYCMLREVGRAPVETPVAACDSFNQRRCDVAAAILDKVCEHE
jgi:septum formation protein